MFVGASGNIKDGLRLGDGFRLTKTTWWLMIIAVLIFGVICLDFKLLLHH